MLILMFIIKMFPLLLRRSYHINDPREKIADILFSNKDLKKEFFNTNEKILSEVIFNDFSNIIKYNLLDTIIKNNRTLLFPIILSNDEEKILKLFNNIPLYEINNLLFSLSNRSWKENKL